MSGRSDVVVVGGGQKERRKDEKQTVVRIKFEALFAVKKRGLPSGELGISGGAVGIEDSVGGITFDGLSVALDGLREFASGKGLVSAVLGFEGEGGALVGLLLCSLLLITDGAHQLLDVSVAVLDERRLKGVDGLVVLSEGTEGISNTDVRPDHKQKEKGRQRRMIRNHRTKTQRGREKKRRR